MTAVQLRKLLYALAKYRTTCENVPEQDDAMSAAIVWIEVDIKELDKQDSEVAITELSKRLKKKDRATLATALRLAGTR